MAIRVPLQPPASRHSGSSSRSASVSRQVQKKDSEKEGEQEGKQEGEQEGRTSRKKEEGALFPSVGQKEFLPPVAAAFKVREQEPPLYSPVAKAEPTAPAAAAKESVQTKWQPTARRSEGSLDAVARSGVSGAGNELPYLSQIQKSFGRHDISGVVAHTDGTASKAVQALGASAYARGNHVAFDSRPSLHTAAHEAAHTVQQRSGLQLPGGWGRAGDQHEQHADAVADRVVRGQSSEALLDAYAGAPVGGTQAKEGGATQRESTSAFAAAGVQLDKHKLTAKEKAEKEVEIKGWFFETSKDGKSTPRSNPETGMDPFDIYEFIWDKESVDYCRALLDKYDTQHQVAKGQIEAKRIADNKIYQEQQEKWKAAQEKLAVERNLAAFIEKRTALMRPVLHDQLKLAWALEDQIASSSGVAVSVGLFLADIFSLGTATIATTTVRASKSAALLAHRATRKVQANRLKATIDQMNPDQVYCAYLDAKNLSIDTPHFDALDTVISSVAKPAASAPAKNAQAVVSQVVAAGSGEFVDYAASSIGDVVASSVPIADIVMGGLKTAKVVAEVVARTKEVNAARAEVMSFLMSHI